MVGPLNRIKSHFIAVLLITGIVLAFTQMSASAATITDIKPGAQVSLRIPTTELLVKGCVAPNSLVTIVDGNTVVGTVGSTVDGTYERLLSSQTPTIHIIKTYFDDPDGNRSTPTSDLVALAEKSQTILSVNPPPTVKHLPDNVQYGKSITFKGYTCPNKVVQITIDGNVKLTATSNSSGLWTISLNSINFSKGAHFYTVSATGSGFQTNESQKYQFSVVESDSTVTVSPVVSDLSIPVVITSPEDGLRTTDNNILITGTGPPNTQIEVYVDGKLIGSVFSNAFGEWSLQYTLFGPLQTISARACNSDGCEDYSSSVKVSYGEEQPIPNSCDVMIRLKNYRYSSLEVSKGIDIELIIENYKEDDRYQLVTDWGDITTEHQTLNAEKHKMHHTYNTIGQFNGTVTVSDESGCRDIVYFSVEVEQTVDRNYNLVYLLLIIIIYFAGRYYLKKR